MKNEDIKTPSTQMPNITIDNKNDSTKYIVGGVLFILTVLGVYLWYTFIYKKAKADKEKNTIDPNTKDGKAKIYAQKFDSAIHYYGDDESLIYSAAMAMKNDGVTFAQVAEAYQSMYNRNLSTYLSSNLNTADYNRFLSIIGQPSTLAVSKPSFTPEMAASIAAQLLAEMKKGIIKSSSKAMLEILKKVTLKADWVMIYNAFGTKAVNFQNKDLTNWIRTIFPSGKKEIFNDLNTRLGTNLS
ncbi:MAG: hypothetical protein HGA42_00580 [Nostocales cyanobacterium W4_Combined_metabat2_030]|nr:hypothetical protein [Nostocales cyanobacterium W4_Combined_metabat2_030]